MFTRGCGVTGKLTGSALSATVKEVCIKANGKMICSMERGSNCGIITRSNMKETLCMARRQEKASFYLMGALMMGTSLTGNFMDTANIILLTAAKFT